MSEDVLSVRVLVAIRAACEATQEAARERYAGDDEAQGRIDEMVDMLYELQVSNFATFGLPILAVVWQEALEAVQEEINENLPLEDGTVLVVDNPYAV